ncbi:MAG: amidohydrolase [Oscillospiraceae bacterium]
MSRKLYYNGKILTATDENPVASAVVVENGRISRVIYDAENIADDFAPDERVDLNGTVLAPGFIDGHSHFFQTISESELLNAKTSPAGECDSVEQLVESLKKQLSDPRFDDKRYLYASGYDESVYPDHRLPTRYDLDRVTDRPLALSQISGHNTVFNSAALKLAGIDDSYEPPYDGSVGRFTDGSLTGVFYENARRDIGFELSSVFRETAERNIGNAVLNYSSAGVTTAQDAATSLEQFETVSKLAEEGKLPIDLVSYLFGEDTLRVFDDPKNTRYSSHYRAAGYKIFLDGSPQAKTAWLSKPYEHTLLGRAEDYRGSGILTDEQLAEILKNVLGHSVQINVHTNGDEAVEQFLRVYEAVSKNYPEASATRPVLIHCQIIRTDQIERMKKLGILASFFVDHVYYWGDYHEQEILGTDRAKRISPLAEALEKGVSFSIHQDTPVTKQSPIFAIHNAVNRLTRSGRVLGEEYRITPQEALKAVTINAAYQIFEERSKGSIEEGKLADFVILDRDILTVPAQEIKNIKVLETIKEGQTVYKRKE